MSQKELKKFHGLLAKEKKQLEKKLRKLGTPDFGDDVDSGEEEADEVEERVTNAAIRNLLEGRLTRIEEALEDIEKGTYGVCKNCGNEISVRLLEVDPESKLCQTCKALHG